MRRFLLEVIVVAFAAGCAISATAGPAPTTTAAPTTLAAPPTTLAAPATTAATTTTSRPPLGVAALARRGDGTPRVVTTPSGVVLPVAGVDPDGVPRVRTTCGPEARYAGGVRHDYADIVLDAGHGGSDSGAFQHGKREADVNFDLAQRVRSRLAEQGLRVLLTRESDYYVPLQFRADIASAAQAKLFISLHHNSGGGSRREGPGTEVYYQQNSAESKRLAGLLWEDVYHSLDRAYDIEWWGAGYAGAVFRQGRTGADFYGVIRRTGGVPATLLEVAFLSNRAEAALIGTEEFADRSADAIARAIVRYFTTTDPGAGFRDTGLGPIPGSVPSGGIPSNCREPAYD